ncbi:MAG: hypothetical protein QOF63_1416 [Thermoanaerobaculia bacterium]|jgi:hypothetical protein|nr:hypothetical protein [Thermoanaerobaculia bacterium]MEA2414983.1 hypothetical protein [Thermoanaerobaculia bacterium]
MAQVAHVQLVNEQRKAGDKLRLRTWIEVQLIGEDDKPIPNQKYTIALPGGAMKSGTLDENGSARIEGIPAGTCKVSFPDLDQDAWTPVDKES